MEFLIQKELTNKILKSYYKVYNTLGFGFLEKVYENALMIELYKNGIKAIKQKPIKVFYENQIVGEYFADIIVEESIILELKAVEHLIKEDENQLINYLKSTNIEIGLLLNFGKEPEIRRKFFSNERKKLNLDNSKSV